MFLHITTFMLKYHKNTEMNLLKRCNKHLKTAFQYVQSGAFINHHNYLKIKTLYLNVYDCNFSRV